MLILGRQFEFVVASDANFDGIRLELVELVDDGRQTLADISYSDRDGTMTLQTFEGEVPVEAIEATIKEARHRFGER